MRSITLGLSYSLTDDHVFSFLNQLPELTSVELQYYLQLKIPTSKLRLPSLSSFTAKYTQLYTRDEVNRFCAWVRRAISSSHNLQVLRLVISSNGEPTPNLSFDGLVHHLTTKHFRTLAVLDFGSAFIGGRVLKQLCIACVHLECLTAGVGLQTLLAFGTQGYASTARKLHTVSFHIVNTKRSKVTALLDTQKATEIILGGPPQLRRLAVNGVQWEGFWESASASEATFVVRAGIDVI